MNAWAIDEKGVHKLHGTRSNPNAPFFCSITATMFAWCV